MLFLSASETLNPRTTLPLRSNRWETGHSFRSREMPSMSETCGGIFACRPAVRTVSAARAIRSRVPEPDVEGACPAAKKVATISRKVTTRTNLLEKLLANVDTSPPNQFAKTNPYLIQHTPMGRAMVPIQPWQAMKLSRHQRWRWVVKEFHKKTHHKQVRTSM